MAHITRWAGIGQSFFTNFGNLASNNSGVNSTHYSSDKRINDQLLAGNGAWNAYTAAGDTKISHEVAYAAENVTITGYITWKSGGKSNTVQCSDTFSSYEPATTINLSTNITSVYSDYAGNINLFATINGSRSASNAAVNFAAEGKPVGSGVTNTSYAVAIDSLAKSGWGEFEGSMAYYFTVTLDPASINNDPTTTSTIVSNKSLSKSTAITIKSAAADINVADYSIHINAKDVYTTSYTVLAYGTADIAFDETISCAISNSAVASVSVNEGRLSITGKDISNSATKFSSATITLKSMCTSKSAGVTNSKPITLYVYDNSITLVNINSGDKYTATLVTVEVENEKLDKLPTIIPVGSLSSTTATTATYASVGAVTETKGPDNKYRYNVIFTGVKAGIQYFYVSNGTWITVNVSDITLTLSLS